MRGWLIIGLILAGFFPPVLCLSATDWIYLENSSNSTVFRVFNDVVSNYATVTSACSTNWGGRLLVLKDYPMFFNASAQLLMLGCDSTYIGLTQNNGNGDPNPNANWCYVDGTCPGFIPWATGQPSGGQYCGALWGSAGGYVDDYWCTNGGCYVCEVNACPGGLVANPITQKCDTACPQTGHYNNAGFCRQCPAGKFSISTTTTSCTDCVFGAVSAPGSSSCAFCSAGKYKNGYQCSSCPLGTYSVTEYALNSSVCMDCPETTYNNKPGATGCADCGVGYWSAKGSVSVASCTGCPLGYYRPELTPNCTECPAGKYRSVSTSGDRCDECPIGTYNEKSIQTSSGSCLWCPAGKYSIATSASSASSCQDCRPGTASEFPRSTSCSVCEAGKFSKGVGSSICLECPRGYYSESAGSIDCLACPPGSTSRNSGSTSQSACEVCPGGKFADPTQSSCQPCPEGFYGSSKQAGLQNITSCKPCPQAEGLKCPLGSPTPFVASGYYRDLSIDPEEVKLCVPEEACPEAGFGTTSCAEGYQGEYCSECTPFKFYRKDRNCLKCSSQWFKWVLLTICIIGGVWIVFSISIPSDSFTSKLRIALAALQILAIFPRLTSDWSPSMFKFLGLLSVSNLNVQFFSVDCNVQVDYWKMWVFQLMFPFLAIAFFAILYLLNRYGVYYIIRKKLFKNSATLSHQRSPYSASRYVYSFVLILNILYLHLIVLVVEPFQCMKQDDGTFTLLANPAVQCFDHEWRGKAIPVIAIFGPLYIIIVPSVFVFIFLKNRQKVFTDNFISKYGALTRPFSKDFYWFEMIIILKKICIVLIPDVISAWISADVRVLTSFIAMFFFFLIECFCQPYRNKLFNRQNLLWSSVLLFVLLTSFITGKESSASDSEKAVFTALDIILIVSSVLYSFTTFTIHVVNTTRAHRKSRAQQVGEMRMFDNPVGPSATTSSKE